MCLMAAVRPDPRKSFCVCVCVCVFVCVCLCVYVRACMFFHELEIIKLALLTLHEYSFVFNYISVELKKMNENKVFAEHFS
jgi:hypothetical protein